jgi:hypothetical protein
LNFSAFGNEKGNGGGVHVCQDGRIEVYDIYEGFTRYNLTPTKNRKTADEYLAKAVSKIRSQYPGVGYRVEKYVDYLRKEGHFLIRNNLNLYLIEDADILVTDVGCRYQQLANWDDRSENVLVKNEFFQRLDALNQAAIFLHEAVYKVARNYYNESNSDESRRIVAEALSDEAGFTNLKHWSSWTNDSVVVDPRPFNVELLKTEKYFKGPLLNVHLGDVDLYDQTKNVFVKINFDYSAAENVKKSIQVKLDSIDAQITSLNGKLSSARFPWNKKDIKEKIFRLEDDKLPLLSQINTIDNYLFFYSSTKEIIHSTSGPYRLEAMSPEFDTPSREALEVKVTYRVFIGEEEVFKGTSSIQRDINPVYYLVLNFTQNRK